MAEELVLGEGTKSEKYETLIPQIKALVMGEPDLIANCANIAAAIRQTFGFFWVGFYFVKDDELVLGPFQGDIACTRIGLGKGVCGTAWKEEKTILVSDVNEFPGHIACSAQSVSEIVVPIIKNGTVRSVLDVDSIHHSDFDEMDQKFMEEIAVIVADLMDA